MSLGIGDFSFYHFPAASFMFTDLNLCFILHPMIYQIKRHTDHKRLNFPIIGATTGKQWLIMKGEEVLANFLFSPIRSACQTETELYVIEPLHYDDHKENMSEDEHTINVFRDGRPYNIGNMSTRFPTFRKATFNVKVNDKSILLKGQFNAFSSPSLDTSIHSRDIEPSITASTKFTGPEGEFDSEGEVHCADEFWAEHIYALIFFLEMDMINTIVDTKKKNFLQ